MPSEKSLFDYAIGLLARRDYSVASLRRKLVERQSKRPQSGEENHEDLDAIVSRLTEMGYLDDERYRDRFIEAHRNRDGSMKIAAALASKGLSRSLIEAKRSDLEAKDPAAAFEVWRRRFGLAPTDFAERNRQSRFLAQRGFPPATIGALFRRIAQGDGDPLSWQDETE